MYLRLSFGIGGSKFGAGDIPRWELSTTRNEDQLHFRDRHSWESRELLVCKGMPARDGRPARETNS